MVGALVGTVGAGVVGVFVGAVEGTDDGSCVGEVVGIAVGAVVTGEIETANSSGRVPEYPLTKCVVSPRGAKTASANCVHTSDISLGLPIMTFAITRTPFGELEMLTISTSSISSSCSAAVTAAVNAS